MNSTISKLLYDQYELKYQAFLDGKKEGESKNVITVEVDPIENYSGTKYYLWSTEKVEIGFKYTLVINGVRSEYKSEHIIKSVKTSKINDDNIQTILDGLKVIENLNPKLFIVSSSFKFIKDSLLKRKK